MWKHSVGFCTEIETNLEAKELVREPGEGQGDLLQHDEFLSEELGKNSKISWFYPPWPEVGCHLSLVRVGRVAF
jgi:hypothetical protein